MQWHLPPVALLCRRLALASRAAEPLSANCRPILSTISAAGTASGRSSAPPPGLACARPAAALHEPMHCRRFTSYRPVPTNLTIPSHQESHLAIDVGSSQPLARLEERACCRRNPPHCERSRARQGTRVHRLSSSSSKSARQQPTAFTWAEKNQRQRPEQPTGAAGAGKLS